MPFDMASLLSKPMAPTPADGDAQGQGGSGGPSPGPQGGAAPGLAGLMGGASGGGAGPPAPTYQQTVSAVRHMARLERDFRGILAEPNIGKTDVKGPFIDVMADLMGEGFSTLPQVLDMMKQFPTNPLEQRQWLEQQVSNNERAQVALLQQHAAAFPEANPAESMAALQAARGPLGRDHADTLAALSGHYKARGSGGRR
jgi:hypothetical protein